MYAIETRGLSHRFSKTEMVVTDVALQVPEGSLYGFLGPNGAGKTTTLKLLLGLLTRQQGAISILGKSMDTHRIDILRQTGSLIEAPSFYAHLSAAENLQVLQKVYRCPAARIQEVLAIVGLSHTGSKKAGRFSLGMKQRLSIAIALLAAPSLLILDEPTNGLDPNGIIEMRELLKRLNKEQRITIVVSSHLLTEVEKLVTHVGIINKGKLMFQGSLAELLQLQQQAAHTVLDTGNNEGALQLIIAMGIAAHMVDGKVLLPVASRGQVSDINAQLARHAIAVYEVATVRNDLETIFMNLIKN